MRKEVLANELRSRQIELKLVSEDYINYLSDDEIIRSYVTCSDCGKKVAADSIVEWLINKANDMEHFIEMIGSIAKQ